MTEHQAAVALHPVYAALALHHPKKFHIGSLQVAHMTGTQGSWVILIALMLAALYVVVRVLRS